MPARRRGQEAQRRARRIARQPVLPPPYVVTEDEVWAEHQCNERHRRAPIPLDEVQRREERRRTTWGRVLRAVSVVERDLANWRRVAVDSTSKDAP